MILSYQNCEDSFSCDSDSGSSSNNSSVCSSRSPSKRKSVDNILGFETKVKEKPEEETNTPLNKKQKVKDIHTVHKKLLSDGSKYLSSCDLSFLKTNIGNFRRNSLNKSDSSISVMPVGRTKNINRKFSISSLQNLMMDFADEEELNQNRSPKKAKHHEDSIGSETVANIRDLLKGEVSEASSISNFNLGVNIKKSNYILKSELYGAVSISSKASVSSISSKASAMSMGSFGSLRHDKKVIMKPIDETSEGKSENSNIGMKKNTVVSVNVLKPNSNHNSFHNNNARLNYNTSYLSALNPNNISYSNINMQSPEKSRDHFYVNNISNSTDELFAHLNNKIDNFDVTTITQQTNNSFVNVNGISNLNAIEDIIGNSIGNINQNNKNIYTNFPNYNNIIYDEVPNKQNNHNHLAYSTSKFKKNHSQNMPIPSKPATSNFSELSDLELAKLASIISCEQSGCRFIQKRIIDNPSFANEVLFYEIEGSFMDLILDAFGNYLIQKVIENIDEEKIEWIIDLVAPFFLEVSTSPHGTRVVQKLIENLRSATLLYKFNAVLSNFLILLSKDNNANHIIQKYVYTVRAPHNQFVYDILLRNLVEVSTDKHGCCVMQKLIDASDSQQKKCMIDVILKRTLSFISDQYANYVIQFILSLSDFNVNKIIAEIFLCNLSYLCKHKFSSNVIEKCFDHSNEEIQDLIITAIANDETLIPELIVDMYGNYVLQKALALAKKDNYMKILRSIGNNLDKLKLVPFGNKLLAKFLNNYKELPSIICSSASRCYSSVNAGINRGNLNAVQSKNPKRSYSNMNTNTNTYMNTNANMNVNTKTNMNVSMNMNTNMSMNMNTNTNTNTNTNVNLFNYMNMNISNINNDLNNNLNNKWNFNQKINFNNKPQFGYNNKMNNFNYDSVMQQVNLNQMNPMSSQQQFPSRNYFPNAPFNQGMSNHNLPNFNTNMNPNMNMNMYTMQNMNNNNMQNIPNNAMYYQPSFNSNNFMNFNNMNNMY